MKLAVTKYAFWDNPLKMPDSWPAHVRELPDNATLSMLLPNEMLMTPTEFENYKKDHFPEYQSWQTQQSIAKIPSIVSGKVINAMDFGRQLIADYSATKVLSALNITQIQEIMNRLSKVMQALQAGSLYVALSEIDKVELDDTLITAPKVAVFKKRITDYLGIT